MAPFGGGMEHQTMTSQGTFNANLTAHELGHQWFGNHVTCGSWADIWVNEGFATYSEYLMNERLYPAQAATVMNSEHTAAMQQANGAIWILDSLNSTRIFSSRLSYSKGAAFIHTLRYLVNNDSLFFNALREYQIRFADSTAIGTDVKKVLEDIGGVNLDEAFEQWYYGEGYPTYSLRWNTGNNNLYLKLSQTVSAPGITPLFTTPLQIRFSRPGRPDTIIRFPITSATEFILVPGISSVSGTPVLDPSNYIINKTTLVQKDPTLVVTKNEALEVPKPDVVILSTSEDGRFLLQSNGRESWEYAVLDTRGRLVGSGCLDQCQELNLSNCLSGVYLVRFVSASGNQVSHRLIRR
jgi:aminopeptidase N